MLPLILAASNSASHLHRRPMIHRANHSLIESNFTLFESNEICNKPPDLNENIFSCIENQDMTSFRYLICSNPKKEINQISAKSYYQPLGYTVAQERYGMTFDLLNKYSFYIDINYQNKFGNTALHWAYTKRHSGIICKLLELGADPNIYNANGNIPEDNARGWKPTCN